MKLWHAVLYAHATGITQRWPASPPEKTGSSDASPPRAPSHPQPAFGMHSSPISEDFEAVMAMDCHYKLGWLAAKCIWWMSSYSTRACTDGRFWYLTCMQFLSVQMSFLLRVFTNRGQVHTEDTNSIYKSLCFNFTWIIRKFIILKRYFL